MRDLKYEYDYFDGDLFETDSESYVCFTKSRNLEVYATVQIHIDRYFIVKIIKDGEVIKSCNILFEKSEYSYSNHYKLSKEECTELYELLISKPDISLFEKYNTNWEALVATHNYENDDDDFHGEVPDYRLLK